MNCLVCFEKYDNDKRRPFTLYPCSHTICLNCLIYLPQRFCPSCRSLISDSKPNYGLIDLLLNFSPSLTDLTKTNEINQLIIDIESLKQKFDSTHQNKRKEISDRFKTIRNKIQLRAEHLINETNSIENELTKQLDQHIQETQFEAKLRNVRNSLQLNGLSQEQFDSFKHFVDLIRLSLNEKISDIINLEVDHIEYKIGEIEIKKNEPDFSELNNSSASRIRHVSLSDHLNLPNKSAIKYYDKKGDLSKENKNYAEAIEFYMKVIEIDPCSTDVYIKAGICLKSIQKFNEALDMYNKALISVKDNNTMQKYIVLSNKAATLRLLNRHREALHAYDMAISLNQDNPVILNDKANTFLEMKEYEAAILSYDKAIFIHSLYTESWINKGICLRNLKRYEQAFECFERSIEIVPNNLTAHLNKALTYHMAKQFHAALTTYNKCIQISPNNCEVFNSKGSTWFELKQYEKAIECYDKSIQINSNNPITYYNKGLALNQMKKFQEALLVLDEAISLKENYADAYLAKGYSLKFLHRYSDALACFKKANQINPNLIIEEFY